MTLTDDQLHSLRERFKYIGSRDLTDELIALVEEVERLRAAEAELRENGLCLASDVERLAAKAEAGKGLRPFVGHKPGCDLGVIDCTCGRDAALARWEAANG